MSALRTPEERFEALPGFPWAPRYLDRRGLQEWGEEVAREALARWR